MNDNINFNFNKMRVWQMSMELTKTIYLLTKEFPAEERFGLTDQIRRAAVSIPSNIAEGCGRNSAKEFKHFLSISRGSVYEVNTQLILSVELGYTDNKTTKQAFLMLEELSKMLTSIINKF